MRKAVICCPFVSFEMYTSERDCKCVSITRYDYLKMFEYFSALEYNKFVHGNERQMSFNLMEIHISLTKHVAYMFAHIQASCGALPVSLAAQAAPGEVGNWTPSRREKRVSRTLYFIYSYDVERAVRHFYHQQFKFDF